MLTSVYPMPDEVSCVLRRRQYPHQVVEYMMIEPASGTWGAVVVMGNLSSSGVGASGPTIGAAISFPVRFWAPPGCGGVGVGGG